MKGNPHRSKSPLLGGANNGECAQNLPTARFVQDALRNTNALTCFGKFSLIMDQFFREPLTYVKNEFVE